MNKLILCDQEAFFLRELLSRILSNPKHESLFITRDENDELSFDNEFKFSILDIDKKLFDLI